jgi:UPF0271 protein
MSAPRTLDVNCDLGESYGAWTLGEDEAVLPHVSSANVACGFHAGDPGVMRRTVELCLEHGVAIGAHPGFPDLLGFGRRRMTLQPHEAADYITYQAGAMSGFARAAGTRLHHVKPHGAFFALLRDDPSLAEAAAEAVARCGDGVLAYWPAPARGVAYCDALLARGVPVVQEIYPDLQYDPEGRLVIEPRKQWTDPDHVRSQVARFLRDGTVAAEDGTAVAFPDARSLCVHGDGPNAAEVARVARETIEAAGAVVAAPEVGA